MRVLSGIDDCKMLRRALVRIRLMTFLTAAALSRGLAGLDPAAP